jgi:hypothetical protein
MSTKNKSKGQNDEKIKGFLGELRRSHVVGLMGPGAIVDFSIPGDAEPISGVITGLDNWRWCNDRTVERESIHETRLQRRYSVVGFMQPPASAQLAEYSRRALSVVRFPDWLLCPSCHTLKPAARWSPHKTNPHHPGRYCVDPFCVKSNSRKPRPVVPARLLVACQRGHLDEFPWSAWIGCTCSKEQVKLTLESTGAGLAGMMLSCQQMSCPGHTGRSLEGALAQSARYGVMSRCRGRQIWTFDHDKDCDERPRVMQRGASNIYWGAVDSALDIPPFSEDHTGILRRYAQEFEHEECKSWPVLIRAFKLERDLGMTQEQITGFYDRLFGSSSEVEKGGEEGETNLLLQEYRQFELCTQRPTETRGFDAEPAEVPAILAQYLDGVVSATRLREVRVLYGFSRITPPAAQFAENNPYLAPLSSSKTTWLPGIELRGEGIFLSLKQSRLEEWEQRPQVRLRLVQLFRAAQGDLANGESLPGWVTARGVLIHSLSHILIRQLAQTCSYNTSALTERLYCNEQPHMAGLLIHTGATDADGTLGGLVQRAQPEYLEEIFLSALREATWCSSDPLCITDALSLSSPRSLAACHACLLTSETACRHMNQYLDRALLIGTPDDPSVGFFSDLLRMIL